MVWVRAAGIGLLAYGLTAVWLTPSFLKITARNLKYVAQPMTNGSLPLAFACLLVVCLLSWWWAKNDFSKAYAVFVWGSMAMFSLNVLGHYYWDFRISGEPDRLVPELDLVIILGVLELFRRMWTASSITWLKPALTILTIAVTIYFGRYFLRHPWKYYIRDDYTQRQEFIISKPAVVV